MVDETSRGFTLGQNASIGCSLGSTTSVSNSETSTSVSSTLVSASSFGLPKQLPTQDNVSFILEPSTSQNLGGFSSGSSTNNRLPTTTNSNLSGFSSSADLASGQACSNVSNTSFSSLPTSSNSATNPLNSSNVSIQPSATTCLDSPRLLTEPNKAFSQTTTCTSAVSQSTFGSTFSDSTQLKSNFGKVEDPTLPVSTNASGCVMNTTSLSMISSGNVSLSNSNTGISTTVTTNSTVAQPLTYNQLEEFINKWTHELDEQEQFFLDEANCITQWDLALIKNAENIIATYDKVEACQKEQTRLDQELDFIQGQQSDLEQLVEPLERAVLELLPGHLHSGQERETIFQLATNVDLELGQLLTDLREMAQQTNECSNRLNESSAVALQHGNSNENVQSSGLNTEAVDVMQQITRILNCHMHSLNWIHHNTQEVMDRLKMLSTS